MWNVPESPGCSVQLVAAWSRESGVFGLGGSHLGPGILTSTSKTYQASCHSSANAEGGIGLGEFPPFHFPMSQERTLMNMN